MYYGAQPDGTEDVQCLGLAISDSPEGPFTDIGTPFYCGSSTSDIDPMVLDDPMTGKPYLYWGSGGIIVVQELASDLLGFASGTEPTQLIVAGDYEYEGTWEDVVEGPWVTYREGYYYLFYSGDTWYLFTDGGMG